MITMNATDQKDQEFVGYRAAADYLGMKEGTLAAYCSKTYGPDVHDRRADRGYMRPIFLRSELDRWKRERPGRGARTDRQHTGLGYECLPCAGICTVNVT